MRLASSTWRFGVSSAQLLVDALQKLWKSNSMSGNLQCVSLTNAHCNRTGVWFVERYAKIMFHIPNKQHCYLLFIDKIIFWCIFAVLQINTNMTKLFCSRSLSPSKVFGSDGCHHYG